MAKKKANEPDEVVTYWLNEISSSRKREKDYRKEGQRILDIYSGKKADSTPFNILYSNTETLLPALYSAVPRPVVNRRFKDEDPMGKAAATAGQRVLEFLLDTNVEGYETFDQGVRSAVLDALLPGRGITCVKYDADVQDVPQETGEPLPVKNSELVCLDTRSWDRVSFGYAKKWSKVPWVAYEEHLDKDESERLFGKEIASKIVFTEGEDDEKDEDGKKTKSEERDQGQRKTALVYQIWDKDDKKVRYVSPQYTDGFLKVDDDPLGLTGFFNCPKPIQFLEKSNDLTPVSLYMLYENQAKELNKLTVRINRIVEAIKARGVYDTELGEDIGNIMKADDNALVPADKSSSLAAEKGLQNAIWFMPIEQLTNVLQQLYIARENCKKVIFEITGIADIMRGQSNASETLGAQEIKQSWGTLRLKRLQKEVQRYARDLLRMMLEIASTKFSEQTFAQMTGLPFLLDAKFNELTAIEQALKGQVQQEQMQQQLMTQSQSPQGQPSQGQPPQQPPSNASPTVLQLQQVQAQLQTPQWSKVLDLLKNDTQRSYRIDIETNSTVEAEAVEDQKNIGEVMTALGQYLNGVTPLITSGAMPFQAAQAMMLAIVRRFRFGPEIEDYIKAMQPPKPPDDGKAQASQTKMQMDQQSHQADIQMKQQDGQQKAQEGQMKLQIEQLKIEVEQIRAESEKQRVMLEMEATRQEHVMKMAELGSKHAVNMATGEMKMKQMKQKSSQVSQ